ncbi:MAG: hypothetical protein ACJ795_09510, partial [Ktedonobacteraceae bacterium]
ADTLTATGNQGYFPCQWQLLFINHADFSLGVPPLPSSSIAGSIAQLDFSEEEVLFLCRCAQISVIGESV